MTLQTLKLWINEKINENPDLESEITDVFEFCLDQIEDGESEPHEIELCMSDINDLIKTKENERQNK